MYAGGSATGQKTYLIVQPHVIKAKIIKNGTSRYTGFREGMTVHGRYNQPCLLCHSPVQRIRYATNETNYCPTCQTGGKILAGRALSRLLKKDWPCMLDELEQVKSKRLPD
jgi:formamidopyrimidine-DNA glycosylase